MIYRIWKPNLTIFPSIQTKQNDPKMLENTMEYTAHILVCELTHKNSHL